MSDNYIGLVMVRHPGLQKTVYLFEAPAFNGLKKGDSVLCRTVNGNKIGTVVHTDNVIPDSDAFKMWVDVTNAKLPLKRIEGVFDKCKYKDEKESDDNA